MSDTTIETLFSAGTHFGYQRTRRHPTASTFLFGTKEHTDIFDLDETVRRLDAALAYAAKLAQSGRTLLFVGGKDESSAIVKSAADSCEQPYVASRWIGGTLTNFKNIRKRIERMETLIKEKEAGELDKYTKKERLLIDREIERLQFRFGGLTNLSDVPAALYVVDSRHEHTAISEANQLKIPVIGLLSSDCDFSKIKYPIPGNDTSIKSVRLVCEAVAGAYNEGKRAAIVARPQAAEAAN